MEKDYIVIQITLNGMTFWANGKTAQLLTNRITFDENDPVLNCIAKNLEVTIFNLLSVLDIFNKFFPDKPERSK